MSLSNAQRRGFEDRLSRIKNGGDNTMGEVHIGPREEVRAGEKRKPNNTVRMKKKTKSVKLGEGSSITLVPLAFIFGAMSMFVGQAAAYHFFADTGLIQLDLSSITAVEPYLPYAHFLFGGVLALLFAWTFRMMGGLRILALVGGLAVMVHYQADIVQKAPGLYQAFFSKAFVQQTLGQA